MAVSLDVVEKTLEDLEKEVTCAVCQEHYIDPKILPCLHYYCKDCILKLALKVGKNKPFSCPECRKDTTLPEEGIEKLKSAFIINRLKSMYFKHKNVLSQQAQCEMCSCEASAEAYCKQCDKFACKNCVQMHAVLVAFFEGHEIVAIEQIQKVKTKELFPKTSKRNKCQLHKKSLKIFCFDCNKLICHYCIVKDHKDHNIEFNNVAADIKKKELTESLKPLREVEDSLSRALEEVCNTEHEVKAQGKSVANTIENSFEELHAILETRKEQLLEEAKERMREKIENLRGQKKALSIDNAGIHSVIDYAEQCVNHCSDEEVMTMYTEINQRIQEEMEEHSRPGNKLEPVEKADIGVVVTCAMELQQLCHKAKITPAAVYTMSTIPTSVEVDQVIKMEIVNINTKVSKSRFHLQCQVKYVPTGAVIKPDIEELKSPDRYEVTYTPSVRGRHELSVDAYGQPVQGSPFTVIVNMPPGRLDKPLKEWNGVVNPLSIAVNSVGEIIVAELNKDIVVLDSQGKIQRRIERVQHQITDLRSVAVDNEDNIYFIGHGSNMIVKANRNCDILLVHDIQVKQVKGQGYYDIAVVGDEVMVTELYNDGYIMVYDRELNYIRQITSRNKTGLRCLYPDHRENLYISDDDSTIQVLSKTGEFIHSFGHCGRGVKQLKDPWMMHVCGHYVYVADFCLGKTVVFTTDGDYVSTFGCYGSTFVHQDGFLYISDRWNDKLICY